MTDERELFDPIGSCVILSRVYRLLLLLLLTTQQLQLPDNALIFWIVVGMQC
jgi:hypothetical protein